MGVVSNDLEWSAGIADVPEFDLAVIATGGQIVLLVGVKVEVTHQLTVSVLQRVHLSGADRGERSVHVGQRSMSCCIKDCTVQDMN